MNDPTDALPAGDTSNDECRRGRRLAGRREASSRGTSRVRLESTEKRYRELKDLEEDIRGYMSTHAIAEEWVDVEYNRLLQWIIRKQFELYRPRPEAG